MRCNEEQFEAIKPKLKGFTIGSLENFNDVPYLINNRFNIRNNITNYRHPESKDFNIHETWNEEIFLKACGIEVDSLEQQLQKAEAEVYRLKKAIEEENIKLGDWVHNTVENSFYKIGFRSLTTEAEINQCIKIKNPQLIILLEQEIK